MNLLSRGIPLEHKQLNYLILQSVRYLTQTHYDVLGVRNTASQQEIKAAYKNLCKQVHPDVNKNDPKTHDKFIKLQDAYNVLGKAVTRKEYDMALHSQTQYSQRSRRMNNTTYGQGPTNKEDSYYTYPDYEEILWKRRWNPEKYSRGYERWENENKPLSNSWSYIIFGAIVLNLVIFWNSYLRLRKNLNEKDRRAAESWTNYIRNQGGQALNESSNISGDSRKTNAAIKNHST